MKIVINTISTKKYSGGAYQIASNFLLAALRYREKDVELFYLTSTDLDEKIGIHFQELRNNHYFVYPTQPNFLKDYRSVRAAVLAWEKKYEPDVIYSITSPCYIHFKSKEVMRFTNPWVATSNKYAWGTLSWKDRLIKYLYCLNQRRIIRGAPYFITQTEAVKQGLLRVTHAQENNVCVVNNVLPNFFSSGINTEHINSADSNIHIACIAAPVPHKNLDIVPRILKILRDDHQIKNVVFHLTADPQSEVWKKIEQERCRFSLDDNLIVNHGRMEQDELAVLYRKCDFSLLPTLLEVFSATPLESMFFKLNMIASDFDFNREVMGDCALYYPPTDATKAAEQIVKYIHDKKLRDEHKARMPRQLERFGTYQRHFSCIMDFLKKVGSNS